MKYICLVASLLVALCSPSSAQFNGCQAGFCAGKVSTGGGLDPATTAWVSAVVTAGGSVTSPRQTVVNTFITCVRTAGLWTTLDRFWLLAGENVQSATVDMVNLQSLSQVSVPTFTANVGVVSPDQFNYWNSNYIPSSSSLFLTNSAVFGGQINNARTTSPGGNNTPNFGSSDAGFTVVDTFTALNGALNSEVRINSSSSDTNVGASTKGLWTISRTGASTGEVYLNGASNYAITKSAGGPSTVAMLIGTFQQGAGSALNGPGDTHSSFFAGGGWTSTQAANFYSCHNAMMTSIGIPVP